MTKITEEIKKLLAEEKRMHSEAVVNGYVILPSTFHGKKVDRVQPKFLFLHFPKEKIL